MIFCKLDHCFNEDIIFCVMKRYNFLKEWVNLLPKLYEIASWGRSHKTFFRVNLLTLFVSYTILELWKRIVDNNEMAYVTKNPK